MKAFQFPSACYSQCTPWRCNAVTNRSINPYFNFLTLMACLAIGIITTNSWDNSNRHLSDQAFDRNTSTSSHATIRWIGVGENKNVTLISHPTPISSNLADSSCGRYHPLVSCRWYGVTIVSVHDLGTIIWAKMYPSVIHLVVSLT